MVNTRAASKSMWIEAATTITATAGVTADREWVLLSAIAAGDTVIAATGGTNVQTVGVGAAGASSAALTGTAARTLRMRASPKSEALFLVGKERAKLSTA